MKFIALRIYNTPELPQCDIQMYGYQHGNDPRPYWSMRFYEETWRIPMNPSLTDVQLLKTFIAKGAK